MAAKETISLQNTWKVIRSPINKYNFGIWNKSLYLIGDGRHCMPIDSRKDVQIKEIILLHRLILEEDVVDGEYRIVSCEEYDIRITVHNNLFK